VYEVPLLTKVVRVNENVIPSAGGRDEPIPANIIKPENRANSQHTYHHLSLTN
jgi:hypothetical protein